MGNERMPEPITHNVTLPLAPTLPPRTSSSGPCSCLAKGDPHFTTFDGAHVEVFSPCKYIMAASTVKHHPCAFRVEVKSEKREHARVHGRAYLRLLDVRLPADTVRLHRGGTAYLNGIKTIGDFEGRDFVLRRDGPWMNVTTACNVTVAYDGDKEAVVTMPAAYRGFSSGLCGDCDGNPADDIEADGTPVYLYPSVMKGYEALAQQFLVPDDSDSPDVNPKCQ